MNNGLEGVIAASTAISHIDGINGRLFYRGIDIDELAARSTFEETASLLWYGSLPNSEQLHTYPQTFINNRQIPYEVLSLMMSMPKKTPPMEVLRTAISALSPYDPDDLDNSLEANVHKSVRLTASMPTVIAAWERIRNN
ncbi:MAG: citrate/2-methylcitrate synthase, partial [Roseiflexaceae bacterium]